MAESPSPSKGSTYATILKSSSIVGGSQAVNYVVGLLRTKIVAVLLGPAGVGLIGIYNSTITLAFTITGMGLGNSGVREISAARGANDTEEIGQVQLALRRLAILLGGCGFGFFAVGAPYISEFLFQDQKYTLSVGLIGIILVFNGFKSTQASTIQGFRKIGDLARSTILGTVLSTVVAIAFYATLGERGVVPALITMAAIAMMATFRYAKPLYCTPDDRSWKTTLNHSKRLLLLGAAIAWGALLGELSPFFARALIVRDLGIEANGYYVAAWAISGLFIKFLLSAMWADFFPRLAAVATSTEERNRLVNEQTEIGVIVALPGVIAMTILAPLIIRVLYTAEFTPAADLLPWFVLGLFGRITSWPMGMIVLARGEAIIQALMQTVSASMHLAWLYFMFQACSLQGLAMAFALHYVVYNLLLQLFLYKRYRFSWSQTVFRLILVVLAALLVIAVMQLFLPALLYAVGSSVLLFAAVLYSLIQIYIRVSSAPKLQRLLSKMPLWFVRYLDLLAKHYG